MRILLCDDDDATLEVVRTMLEDIGCDVATAATVDDARLALLAQKFDGVVTDYFLPDGDGGMVSHKARAHGVPCLLVTGAPQDLVRPLLAESTMILDKIGFVGLLGGAPDSGTEHLTPNLRQHHLAAMFKNCL